VKGQHRNLEKEEKKRRRRCHLYQIRALTATHHLDVEEMSWRSEHCFGSVSYHLTIEKYSFAFENNLCSFFY
jgi:hypothetical protein